MTFIEINYNSEPYKLHAHVQQVFVAHYSFNKKLGGFFKNSKFSWFYYPPITEGGGVRGEVQKGPKCFWIPLVNEFNQLNT